MQTTKIFKNNLKAFNEGKKIIINQGGQHSSKTYSILQLIIFLAQITENKVYTIAAESIPFLKVGALRQFLEIMQEEQIFNVDDWNATERIYKMGSNLIEFKGYDTSSKALGAKRDFLFLNEAINIDWDTFSNLEGRTNICTFIDFNPSYEFWAHEKLLNVNKPNVGFIHSTYLDNPFLPPKIIETIEQYKLYDPNRWQVMGLGQIGSNEGMVFNNWHIIDSFPTGGTIRTVYGLDFGYANDPSTAVGIFKIGTNLYVDEILYGVGMTNSDISDGLLGNDLRKHNDEIFADSNEPKSIAELQNRGWRVKPVYKGKDSVNKGIDLLKQYNLFISRRSVNLIKEMRGYQWLKDKNGKPINKPGGADHCIDAMRYAASMRFSIPKGGGFSMIKF